MTILRSLLALVANSIATPLRLKNQTHPLLCRAGRRRRRPLFRLSHLYQLRWRCRTD